MEGMILAAGAGTRLRPLTNDLPKALIRVKGKPLLGWVVNGFVDAGVRRIIINTHHHEEKIREYVGTLGSAGIDFVFSPEPHGPFETGGGLFRAAKLFEKTEPFLLHNADVLSSVPLRDLVRRHSEIRDQAGSRVIASVAVQERDSRRKLLFDDQGLLGWENRGSDRAPDGRVEVREPEGILYKRAFTGIHVLDPAIFGLSKRTGSFSIITVYLELAAEGWVINPLDVSSAEWFDIGTLERLEEARKGFSG